MSDRVWRTEAQQQRQDADPRIALIKSKYPAIDLTGRPSAFLDGCLAAIRRTSRNDSAPIIPNSIARRSRVASACPGLSLQSQSEDFVDGAAAALVALGKMTATDAVPHADAKPVSTATSNWRFSK